MPRLAVWFVQGVGMLEIVSGCLIVAASGMPLVRGVAPEDRWAEAVARAGLNAAGTVVTIGRSIEGREIFAVRLQGDRAHEGERRPTLVVVAGLDGRHVVGSRIALGLIERIAREHRDALRFADLCVVVCANPDGMHRFEHSRPVLNDGSNASRRSGWREDEDRDRRIDEDGPRDLNGDGVVSQMRVPRESAGRLRGIEPAEVPEPDEPRLSRRADAARGETAVFAVIAEGEDRDGDGLVGEDPEAAIDLGSNFPYHWPEFDGRAGPAPLSEPETRALADWLLAMPELVAVLEYGPNDNLINVPVGGKMDQTGEAPISGGVLDADRPFFEAAAKLFKESTAIEGVGGVSRSFDGSLTGWAYAHLGVTSLVTPGWVRPDLVKRSEAKPAGDGAPDEPRRKMPDTEDGKWLSYSDSQPAQSRGFLPWTSFAHPQLGPVEIGGWIPAYRFNPAIGGGVGAEGIESTVADQAKFISGLMSSLPRLIVEPARVQRLGARSWRVTVAASNVGALPTRTAMGVKANRWPPTRWELRAEPERVLAGRRVQGAASIAPGRVLTAEWVIAGDAGTEVEIALLSPECGDRVVSARLTEAAAEDRP